MPFGLVEAEVDDDVSRIIAARLSEIVEHLNIMRTVKWFADDSVTAGDWVQFEAPLNIDVGIDSNGGPLLMWNTPSSGQNEGARLLLHGSEYNMVDASLYIDEGKLTRRPSMSRTAFFIDYLKTTGAADAELRNTIEGVLRQCDSALAEPTASWMSGYARVTLRSEPPQAWDGDNDPVLIASPLFVERVATPVEGDR